MNMFPFLLNKLGRVDIIFFLSILAIILLVVGFYFLIPLLNKKQYAEQRENLRKREKSFKANLNQKEEPVVTEGSNEETKEEDNKEEVDE